MRKIKEAENRIAILTEGEGLGLSLHIQKKEWNCTSTITEDVTDVKEREGWSYTRIIGFSEVEKQNRKRVFKKEHFPKINKEMILHVK